MLPGSQPEVSSQQNCPVAPQAKQVGGLSPTTRQMLFPWQGSLGGVQQDCPVTPHGDWPTTDPGRWKAPPTAAATPPASRPSRPRRLCVVLVARRRVRRSKVSGVMANPCGAGSLPDAPHADHRTADCTLPTRPTAVKVNEQSPTPTADCPVRIALPYLWSTGLLRWDAVEDEVDIH
jgi:hypothetical protein